MKFINDMVIKKLTINEKTWHDYEVYFDRSILWKIYHDYTICFKLISLIIYVRG